MQHDWLKGPVTLGLVLGSFVLAGPAQAQDRSKPVDKITCEEFLALTPDSQERIAYWVDGYAEAKDKEATIGTVAFDKFGQPIGALVEECQTTPKETLWQKIKKHL